MAIASGLQMAEKVIDGLEAAGEKSKNRETCPSIRGGLLPLRASKSCILGLKAGRITLHCSPCE
jgi:hypothetical protein